MSEGIKPKSRGDLKPSDVDARYYAKAMGALLRGMRLTPSDVKTDLKAEKPMVTVTLSGRVDTVLEVARMMESENA